MAVTQQEPDPPRSRRQQLFLVAAAVLAVLSMAFLLVVIVTKSEPKQAAFTPPPTTSSSAQQPVTSSQSPTPSAPPTQYPPFAYLALWPFAGPADAATWEAGYRTDAREPWHLDAGQTALMFTQNYLGYTTIDTVLSQTPSGAVTFVAVGFTGTAGQVTAAILVLARLGTDANAPWEIVGSKDTTLSLLTPAVGATVTSPVTAGGRITGVTRILTVQVRELDKPAPVGELGSITAGGQNALWSASVPITGHGVLTIAVAAASRTGTVEQFAITGAHA
jgi:hypothetical protein